MKYEIPVCEVIKLSPADLIATSSQHIGGQPGGDTPVVDTDNSDYGSGGES